MNWQDLATESHYQTAEAIKTKLLEGNIDEAKTGIEELVEALGRSDKRALESQIIRLMAHIIKWKLQPQKRSRSWSVTILNARREIKAILKDHPSLKNHLSSTWGECFEQALKEAQEETGIKTSSEVLSPKETFEDEYHLLD